MIYVVGALVALVAYFWWAKQRGDGHAREVYRLTVSKLEGSGIPASAIKAFTISPIFSAIAKGSFGKKTAHDAHEEAVEVFYEQMPKYFELGEKYYKDAT